MKGACNAGEVCWSHYLSWFWPVKLSGSDWVGFCDSPLMPDSQREEPSAPVDTGEALTGRFSSVNSQRSINKNAANHPT